MRRIFAILAKLWSPGWRAAQRSVLLAAISMGAFAQAKPASQSAHTSGKKGKAPSARVSLAPRFAPGEAFRYEMEYETTTNTSRKGLALDPQGPSNRVVDWNATVRVAILPADAGTPGGIRLRATYEQSTARVQSDSFDPSAEQTADQYHKLEGKTVEFTLDAAGKVKYVGGVEEIVNSEKAAQSARDWIGQISASAGAPAGGVSVGQTWSSEEPADWLPIAGMVWRTESQYLRNESCHPRNPDLAGAAGAGAADSARNSATGLSPPMDCAVILENHSLVRSKGAPRDPTPEDLRNNGVRSAGKWEGSGQSLLYVSLSSGLVVSVTQTGTQQMDVTMTSEHDTFLRYFGTISSRSQVSLVANDASIGQEPGKP